MDDKRDEQFVDELLDASLQRYRSEDPRAGLENRILANVRAADHLTRRRGAWVWAFGAATGAVMLFAVVTFLSHRKPVPIPVPQTASRPTQPMTSPRPESAARKPAQDAARLLVRHLPHSSVAPPRPAQFPTPAPLSEQERLLLAYVASTPKSELITPVVRDPKIDPLEIPELKIAKIEIEELPKLNE